MYFLQQLQQQFHLTMKLSLAEENSELSFGNPEKQTSSPETRPPQTLDQVLAREKMLGKQLSRMIDTSGRRAEDLSFGKTPETETPESLTPVEYSLGNETSETPQGADVTAEGLSMGEESGIEGDMRDDEPSEASIGEIARNDQEQIDILRQGSPEQQREAEVLDAMRSINTDLNPTDVAKIEEAIEDFQQSEEFKNLSPDEVRQRIATIREGIVQGRLTELETESSSLEGQLGNPLLSSESRNGLLGQQRGNEYNQSTLRGETNWSGLPESQNQSSRYMSEPAETSASGTTLCSRTAFKNLSKMGVPNPHRGGSAKESYELYGKAGDTGFPQGNSTAKVADIYLDASPRNAQYGHRAAAFQENGKWFILDPYYELPGRSDRLAPVPAEIYLNHMCGTKGRKFWGAQYPEGGSGETPQGNPGALTS